MIEPMHGSRLPVFIPKTWQLPEAILARLGDQPGRQRLMDAENHLLLILHSPPRAEDNERRNAVVFWCSPVGEWKSAPASGGLMALDAHITAYRSRVRELDDQVDHSADLRVHFEVTREINPLRRAARHLLEVMESARTARPQERRLIVLRDLAVETDRAAELAASEVKSALDFALAESNQQQAVEAAIGNREARRLNQLVAFFFPLATLVAIFSMENPARTLQQPGFGAVLVIGSMLGFLVRGMVSRR